MLIQITARFQFQSPLAGFVKVGLWGPINDGFRLNQKFSLALIAGWFCQTFRFNSPTMSAVVTVPVSSAALISTLHHFQWQWVGSEITECGGNPDSGDVIGISLVLIGLMARVSGILPYGLNQELLAVGIALLIHAVDYFEGGELAARTEDSIPITVDTCVRFASRLVDEKKSLKFYSNRSDDELEPVWLYFRSS